MFKKLFLLFTVTTIITAQSPLLAELSSKAKKAAKLADSGDVAGATAIYKELMSKDAKKNADLVKEGREGMVKCELITEREAFKAKRYDEAEKILKSIIADYKDTTLVKDAYTDLVLTRLQIAAKLSDSGKYDECITLLNETKSSVPADTAGAAGITELKVKTLLLAGSKSIDSKDYDKAAAYLLALKKESLPKDDANAVKCAEATTKLAKELLALAAGQIKEQNYEAALKNLNLALTTEQDAAFNAEAKYNCGLAYRFNNQTEKALAVYKEVIASFKTSQYASLSGYDMYLIYIDKGGRNEALSSITTASNLSPDNADYLSIRAQLLDDNGDKEEAKRIYTKLADMLPDRIQRTYSGKEKLQFLLGKALMGIGNYSEAAIELDKAVIRDPNFAEARRSLAIAQFNEKAFAEACSNYDVLIKQSSAEFDVLRDSISRNSTTSQDDAQKLEQLRSVIAYYHFVKGLNLEQIGEFEKAEQECRLGLEGVTTKEAATTMKRIQKAIADKHSTSNNPPAQAPAPVQQNTAPAAQPTPAAAPSTPTGHFDN